MLTLCDNHSFFILRGYFELFTASYQTKYLEGQRSLGLPQRQALVKYVGHAVLRLAFSALLYAMVEREVIILRA